MYDNIKKKILSTFLKGKLEFLFWKARTSSLRKDFQKIKILDNFETIDKILSEKISAVRFGDGEFKILFGKGNPNFQLWDEKLEARLKEVILSNDPRVLVCIPLPLYSLKREKLSSKYFWVKFINMYQLELNTFLNTNKIYGNAGITRFYIGQKDKNYSRETFDHLKLLWEQNSVLIVEGELSRIGVSNNIFSNAKSVERIICPSKNAFEKYDEIFRVVREHANEKLVLIALGPAATVLAYDLAIEGIRAIDIGHIDLEYSWMQMNASERLPIKGKHVSELHYQQDTDLTDTDAFTYIKSIIEVI